MSEIVAQDKLSPRGENLSPFEEGWHEDDSGLPVFRAEKAATIDGELANLRGAEGELKLKVAAVLPEASETRFYGERTLERVCEENQINYNTAKKMVAGYKRLRELEIVDRTTFVS